MRFSASLTSRRYRRLFYTCVFTLPDLFRRYSCTIYACVFALPALFAGTLAQFVHAIFLRTPVSQVRLLDLCMRFSAPLPSRRYRCLFYTCVFTLPDPFRRYSCTICAYAFLPRPLSAGTDACFVHALFCFARFPQVLTPVLYMRFCSAHLFRRYSRSVCACALAPHTCFTGTLVRFVHALFCFSCFPQVLLRNLYMCFCPTHPFRRYPCQIRACVFPPLLLSAGRNFMAVHAILPYTPFPQILLRNLCMRFSASPTFRRYRQQDYKT